MYIKTLSWIGMFLKYKTISLKEKYVIPGIQQSMWYVETISRAPIYQLKI